MFEAHVEENEVTGMCEIKITTGKATYTIQEHKINVTKRISEELVKLGY